MVSGKEVLQADDIEPSLPDAGQLLVAVAAASVNPVDFKIRAGKYPAVKDDRWPARRARTFGVVEKWDASVTRAGPRRCCSGQTARSEPACGSRSGCVAA